MSSFKRPPCTPSENNRVMDSLYKGRLKSILPLVSAKWLTDLGGTFLESSLSKSMIPRRIKQWGLDMSEYPQKEYKSFNDFFTRKILPQKRTGVDSSPADALISPCDSRLTVYQISEGLTFDIKGGHYSTISLLKNKPLAQEFAGGLCLVFRLSVDDYHRYCYFDDGIKGENFRINGRYYTVQPLALPSVDFFKENTREYTVMETLHFGKAVQAEIGATFVGRINNLHGRHTFKRGEEKGMFEFGGSTIVLLLKKGSAAIDGDILENSALGMETKVLMGEAVGQALSIR
ncbi:MAG: phosphatidylserine decarboxylase [Clostridiaceae bacterium]|nr:phosphatidylserine decarboxylase [Clostridiaceae bacterium]